MASASADNRDRLQQAIRKVRSSSHPCANRCGAMISGGRMACLKCAVDALAKHQAKEHPETLVDRAAIADFIINNPAVNTF